MSTDAVIQEGASEMAANMSKVEETIISLKKDTAVEPAADASGGGEGGLPPTPPSADDSSELLARAVAAGAAASAAAAPSKLDRWDNTFTRKAQVTKKDGQSLGISVEENTDDNYCFFSAFKEEGAVPDAGVFRENDIILAINDDYVEGMEHGELVNVLIAAFPSFSVTAINESEATCIGEGMSTVTVTKGESWGILAIADEASDVPGIGVDGVKEGANLAGGTLNKGDRIILVNGNDVSNASMDEFVALLGANGDKATLVVRSAKAVEAAAAAAAAPAATQTKVSVQPPQRRVSAVATTTMVIINRGGEDKSLGIALLGDGVHDGHHVAHLVAGGPADKAGVKIGSEILQVADQDISKMSHDEVVKVLAGAGDAIKLTLSLALKEFGEVTTVSFGRVNGSFGFKIIDQSDCDYVRVFEVAEGGAAATSGKMQVGDRLVAINHIDLNGVDHAEVVEILGKTEGDVEFCFQSDSTMLAMPPVEYTMIKVEGGQLGLALVQKDNSGQGVKVGRVLSGGAAAAAGMVAGKDLISVNGVDVQLKTVEDVIALLGASGSEPIVIEASADSDGHLTIPGSAVLADHHTRDITLTRTREQTWGLVFGEMQHVVGHFVKDVLPGIAAGLVHPGDLIRTLNGEDIADLPHDVVVAKLKTSGTEIKLQVVDCQYMAEATSFTFSRAANGGCGLQLVGNLDSDQDVTVNVLSDGPAEHAGVESGMVILKVGDESALHASHRQIEAMVKEGANPVHMVMAAATPRDTGHEGRSHQQSIVSLLRLHKVVVTRNSASEAWGVQISSVEGKTGESIVGAVEGSPSAAARPSFIVGDVIVDFESEYGRDVVLGLPHEVVIERLKQVTGNTLTIRLADRSQVNDVFPNPPFAVRLPNVGREKRGIGIEENASGHGARVAFVRPGSTAVKAGLQIGDRLMMVGGMICSETRHEDIQAVLTAPGNVDCWILPDDSVHHVQVQQPPPPQTHTVELVSLTCAHGDGASAEQQPLGFDVNSLPVGAHIVDNVVPSGIGSNCGVQNGDQIFSIGNMEVFALSHQDVLSLLASGRSAHGGAFNMAVHRRVPIPFRLIEKVVTRTAGHALGMVLAEADHMDPNHTRQVYVAQVAQNSDAFEAGDIQSGDIVVVVNGLDVSEVSMAGITKILMSDSEHTHIVLARSEYHAPQPLIKRTVHIAREEGQSLGCHLMHAVGERAVIVAQIEEDSPAFSAGIHAGDALYMINGVCLTGASDVEVKELLKTCGTEFTMQVGQHENASSVIASTTHHTFRLVKDPVLNFGFRVVHVQNSEGQNTVCITNVVGGSPASKVKALINLGDIIYSVNGKVLVGAPIEALGEALAVDEAEVVLQRNPTFDPSLYSDIIALDNEPSEAADRTTDLLEISTKGSVQISRGANGSFGISICNVDGHIGSRVQSIESGGPADGKGIEKGDIIFGINDQPMLFADYETVLSCFQASGNTIDLILADASSGIDSLKMVHIGRAPGETFGLELQSVLNDRRVSHRVAGVGAGSAVEATNLVTVGDTLVSIDGQGAEVLTHEEIVEILGTHTEVVLVLREDYADMPAQVDMINAVIQRVKTPTTVDVGSLAAVKRVEVDQAPGTPGIRVVQVEGQGAASVGDVVVAVNGRSVLGFPAGEVQAMISSGNVKLSLLPAAAVDTVLLNERQVEISISERGQPLGLQFASRSDDKGARISGITDGSPFAHATPSVAVGNEIISINDTPVQGMLHSDITVLFKQMSAAGGLFVINVRDNLTPFFGANGDLASMAADPRDMISGTTRHVVIERVAGEPLGLSICNDSAPIQVLSIKPGSPADRTNMIFANDIILEVDGVPCQDGTMTSVTDLFKAAGASVQVLLQSCEATLGLKTVTLTKDGKSIGVQLASASADVALGSRILAIQPGSVASQNKSVAVGDNVFGVNGTNVSGMDVDAVKQLIAEAGSTVTLVLQSDASPMPKRAVIDRSNGKKLGFSVADHGDGSAGVYVMHVTEGGAAAQTNMVSQGDRIVMINGVDATAMLHADAVAALTAANTVNLVLVADTDLADAVGQETDAAGPETKTVQLTKVGKSIGVQLVSSSDIAASGSRIFAVEPASAASADPEVAVGDVVLNVGSTDVSGMDADAIKQLIAEAGSTVTLVLQSDASPMPKRAVIDRSNGKKLGFSVSDHGDGSEGVFVLKVTEGGAAAQTNMVSQGDRIVMINGVDATGMLHADAVAALTAANTVNLVLVADEDLADHISSTEFQDHVESAKGGEYIEIIG